MARGRSAPAAEKMERELTGEVVPALRRYTALLAGSGRTLDDVGGARHIAEIVMQALPRPNRFAQRLGAVYATGQLQKLLPARGEGPITDEAVRARRRSGRLIGVRTAEGRWVYPAFQFRLRSGRLFPREDVLELWSELPWRLDQLDLLTLAAWITGPRRDLEGMSPLQWLDERGVDERLKRIAAGVRPRASL